MLFKVLKSNPYLFAGTNLSEGWHAAHNIINTLKLKKPEIIKAILNLHQESILLSALNLPKKDTELLYKHMGHSTAINDGTYQVPPVLIEITKVGKHLLKFDFCK